MGEQGGEAVEEADVGGEGEEDQVERWVREEEPEGLPEGRWRVRGGGGDGGGGFGGDEEGGEGGDGTD